MQKFAIIIPTLNGGDQFKDLLASIVEQTFQPIQKIVIDSNSSDETVAVAKSYGFSVVEIKRQEFNHGATRQIGVQMVSEADIVVFLTQDAILAHTEALENLVSVFSDVAVGASYGRQLPHKTAGPIGAHARLFNYSPISVVKSMADAPQLGIKTAFISNSFAAYRCSTLMDIGGFPSDTILGEDTFVAAKMLIDKWKVAYCAMAMVNHSHDYSWIEEFRRYFDIGVFHAREIWIRQAFGQAEGEGIRFVASEITYIWKNNKRLLPAVLLRTMIKLIAYKLGLIERYIPIKIKKYLSMHKRFWK
jgi:rhamnosyltransferase